MNASIKKISGPLIVGDGMFGAKMYDVVRVGKSGLIGEIIQLRMDNAYIQVYEDTSGLFPGEPIHLTGSSLSVELGPGLLGSILDGIGRPLPEIAKKCGDFIQRGINVPTLDRKRAFEFHPVAKIGSRLTGGEVLGEVQETDLIMHKILVPPNVSGKLLEIKAGKFKLDDTIAKVSVSENVLDLKMYHSWPVRIGRPIKEKKDPSLPLISGQRVFDSFFPILKGGTAAIPGPFGSGKTVSQHQLAKWVDADIVVYIGCGERGNEMTEVLKEFPALIDPRTGRPLMERTVLIANTSNMPVAAREASIYTGITIAEYYRDMGYHVALMADSTSRWAEALREISSRLEEMPGEEGYPAYLASRLAQFYERSGHVIPLGGKESSISIIGAVSPPGGDFSEPVTQNTLRITKVFWALDANLAYKRHFPAINWLNSYSLYSEKIRSYYESISDDYPGIISSAIMLLQKEAELQEIVQLVGEDALGEDDKLILFTAKQIREDFLQQHAYHEVDSYCEPKKQYLMLYTIMHYYKKLNEKISNSITLANLHNPVIDDKVARMKYTKDYEKYIKDLNSEISNIGEEK